MVRDWSTFLLAIFVALAAIGLARPALAQGTEQAFAPGSTCHVAAAPDETFAMLAARPDRWTCTADDWPASAERVAMRFDLRGRAAGTPAPDHLKMARLHFERMEVIAIAADGTTATSTLGRGDLLPGRSLLEAAVAIPGQDADPVAVALIVEQSPSAARLLFAEPVTGAPMQPVAGLDQLLAALLCGLLLAPMFFDLGFYRTLRATFPLYHAAFCALAVVQTATFSGLLLLLTDLSLATQRGISILSFDFMVAASSLFILSFVERGVFARWHRRLLVAMAGFSASLGVFAVFALPLLGTITVTIYYTGYVIYLAALAVILARALRRQSRAIRWVILGHLPLLLVGMTNVIIGLFAQEGRVFDSYWAQNLALGFEVIVTSFAVADRFMILKRERDLALSEARVLEQLTEHDALTGLLNRRAIETRFDILRAQGFTTLAVIDLDHFKQVNDRHGHTVGDQVLKSVAKALKPTGDNSLAFRMGGEEFVLLLRGENAMERAETRRVAISHCLDETSPLTEGITASMGIIEAPHDSLADASFEALYARADLLLYEAKAAGRNRTMAERLKVFRPRRRAERRAAA